MLVPVTVRMLVRVRVPLRMRVRVCECGKGTPPPTDGCASSSRAWSHPRALARMQDPDGEERGQLRLLDDTTFDVVASYGLAPGEMPCSLAAWPRGLPGSEVGGMGAWVWGRGRRVC